MKSHSPARNGQRVTLSHNPKIPESVKGAPSHGKRNRNRMGDAEKLPSEEVCRKADARFVASEESYVLSCLARKSSSALPGAEYGQAPPLDQSSSASCGIFGACDPLLPCRSTRHLPVRQIDAAVGPEGRADLATGSHVLPLDELDQKYGNNVDGFLEREESSAADAGLGDAPLRLLPFPRVPVVLVLWRECEEFRARADLLFDSTCERHLPQDIIWATAMLSVLIMM